MFAVNEKKVIAVIVEGPSDEAALGSILKEYFSSAEIQFVVVQRIINNCYIKQRPLHLH